MDGLSDCRYSHNSIIQCAPNYGELYDDSKTVRNNVDCMDWARRAADLPPMFEPCHEWSDGYRYGPLDTFGLSIWRSRLDYRQCTEFSPIEFKTEE